MFELACTVGDERAYCSTELDTFMVLLYQGIEDLVSTMSPNSSLWWRKICWQQDRYYHPRSKLMKDPSEALGHYVYVYVELAVSGIGSDIHGKGSSDRCST